MSEHFRMKQMARIIKLAFLVRNNPEKYTRPALAKYFQVNKGTIQRDINLLKEMGIEIKAQGKQGYVIVSGFDFMEKPEEEIMDKTRTRLVDVEHRSARGEVYPFCELHRGVTQRESDNKVYVNEKWREPAEYTYQAGFHVLPHPGIKFAEFKEVEIEKNTSA